MPEDKEGKDPSEKYLEEINAAFKVVNEYNKLTKGERIADLGNPTLPTETEPPQPPTQEIETDEKTTTTDDDKDLKGMQPQETLDEKQLIPIYWNIFTSSLLFAPPLLAVVLLFDMFKNRKQSLEVRTAYAVHYCYRLVCAGLWTCFMFWFIALDTPVSVLPGHAGGKLIAICFLALPILLLLTVILSIESLRRQNLLKKPAFALNYLLLAAGVLLCVVWWIMESELQSWMLTDFINNLPRVLVFLFPYLLFAVVVTGLLRVRNRSLSVRYAYAGHYCILLLVAGVLSFIVGNLAVRDFQFWAPGEPSILMSANIAVPLETPPSATSDTELTGTDVASNYMPLVPVIKQIYNYRFAPGMGGGLGSGIVLLATQDNIFFLTCLHVIRKQKNENPDLGSFVDLELNSGKKAKGKIAGYHYRFDLAIIQVKREREETTPGMEYLMPVRDFDSIEVGENIFVIGHPLGQKFSLSNGLVSQKRDEEYIQISAPISPGNSGGPVFDTRGRLLAISTLSGQAIYGAQNVNFATRADAVFDLRSWMLTPEGKEALEEIAEEGEGEKLAQPEMGK